MAAIPPRAEGARAASERVFFALWPDERVRAELAEVGAKYSLQGGRTIAPHNLHVTLAFLGTVPAEQRACIEAAAESLHASAFEFALTYIEWRRKTGIVWLGEDEAVPAL